MNKRQKSKRNMFNVLLAILEKYIAIFANSPVLLQAIEKVHSIMVKIDALHPQQETDTTGVREDRDDIRDDLTDLGLALAGILFNYADDINNKELANQFNLNRSDFLNASIPNFKKLIAQISAKCHELSDKITTYGSTTEAIAELDKLEKDYIIYESKPREATVGKTAITASIATLFDEALKILENKIDKLVLQYKNSNPEFYTEYLNARNVIENTHHKTKAEKEAEQTASKQTQPFANQ